MRVEAHRQHREKGTEISAISIAAKNGHLPAVHVLIAAGADVTSGNKVRNVCPTSTLSAPAESFFLSMPGQFSIQPLHWAAEFGHASVVYLLLSCLVDPNAREKMVGRFAMQTRERLLCCPFSTVMFSMGALHSCLRQCLEMRASSVYCSMIDVWTSC